jgi:hypothetical protein
MRERNKLVGTTSLLIIFFAFATVSSASQSPRTLRSIGQIDQAIVVDFSATVGTVSTYFGTQIDGRIASDSDYQNELRALKPAWVRHGIMAKDLVYPPNSSANDWYWNRLPVSLSFVSSIGARVLFMLNGAPANLCENNQEGNRPRPDCYEKIAEWYAYFLLQVKNLGFDVRQCFWEVWNEPSILDFENVENYVSFYNLVENRLRFVDSGVRIGTAFSYLDHPWMNYTMNNVCSIQFLGWHQYGGYESHDNDTLMSFTKSFFEDRPNRAEQYRDKEPKIANTVSIISEFNVNPDYPLKAGDYAWGHQSTDNSTDDRQRDQFNCALYASALNHMIRSKVYVASFFGGYNFNWGMFYKNDKNETVYFPVYATAKSFSKYVIFGSAVADSSSSDSMIEVLAVKNPSKIIVLINKHSYDVSVTLNVPGCTRFFDLENNRYVDVSSMTLEGYSVVFLGTE